MNRPRFGKVWRQRFALSVVASLTFSLVAEPNMGISEADAGHGTYVDYSWITTPKNIVDMRVVREQLKVPSLLDQACNGNENDTTFGEDYFSALLAKVELLRMMDTEAGTAAIHAALRPDLANPVIQSPSNARDCIGKLAPDWRTAPGSGRRRQVGWATIKQKLLAVPPFYSAPGTDGACGKKDHEGDFDFGMALMIRTWLLARDHYGTFDRRLMDAEVGERAWLQGGWKIKDQTVCTVFGVDIPETENHTLQIWTTRFLHNEWFPMILEDVVEHNPNHNVRDYGIDLYGDTNTNRVNDFNPNNKNNGLLSRLNDTLDKILKSDFLEYNARPYSFNQMIVLLNLYDLAKDQTLRAKVRAVLDLLAAKDATEAMGELRSPPFRRRFEHYWDPLFNGDSISPMMQVWVGDLAPYLTPPNSFTQEAVLAASSSYRPPDVLADIMLNPQHHTYSQVFNGRNQNERAFGQPGFVISGGGVQTDCPYPNTAIIQIKGHCPGSGNDSGTVQPIELIPRRDAFQRTGSLQTKLPTIDSVIHSTNPTNMVIKGNSCIGYGFACAVAFAEGDPQWVKSDAQCRRDTTDPLSKDHILALRFDISCVRSPYFPANSCFFVYIRQIAGGLSFLVTHNCDAAQPRKTPNLFTQFINYFDRAGAHTPLSVKSVSLIGFDLTCSFRLPSSMNGPINPGSLITLHAFLRFNDDLNPTFYATGDPSWSNIPGNSLAVGTAAFLGLDGTNGPLILSDGPAGERVSDYLTPNGLALSTVDVRHFQANGTVGVGAATDSLNIRAYNLTHSDQLNFAQIQVSDASGKFLTQVSQQYKYGELTDNSRIIPVAITNADPTHTYRVQACVRWWRFFTAEDYRTDPQGMKNPTGPLRCVRFTVRPT